MKNNDKSGVRIYALILLPVFYTIYWVIHGIISLMTYIFTGKTFNPFLLSESRAFAAGMSVVGAIAIIAIILSFDSLDDY